MELQIIGTKKCNETKKAIRFFSDRRIKYHFIDLNERELKEGELKSIANSLGSDNLIDKESKIFKDMGLEYMVYDPFDKIMENNQLLKTPIIRSSKKNLIGFNDKELKEII